MTQKLAQWEALILVCLALAAHAVSAADGESGGGGRSDGSAPSPAAAERVVARAPVPDAERPHGEVTLLVRDQTSVVETFLHSRLLRRVVAEIVLKEQANWPRDDPHASDSLAYSEALEGAEREIWRKYQREGLREDRRRVTEPKLVIELTVSPTRAGLALFEVPPEAPAERPSLEERTLMARPALARAYLERNFYLIVADALGIAPLDAARRLREAGGWAPPVPVPETDVNGD